jgi:hypothetical protein
VKAQSLDEQADMKKQSMFKEMIYIVTNYNNGKEKNNYKI